MDTSELDAIVEVADVIQIGARNMQNYALLTEVGPRRRARDDQARPVGDARGAADGRRVRAQGGQREGPALRARHPDVRDRLPLTLDLRRSPVLKEITHLAGGRRSQPRGGPAGARRAASLAGRAARAPTGSSSRRTQPRRGDLRRPAAARRRRFAAYADKVEQAGQPRGQELRRRAPRSARAVAVLGGRADRGPSGSPARERLGAR
jgi:3-deoxy-7-phosphoheptulonate synthase